jgi:hypothetical protein
MRCRYVDQAVKTFSGIQCQAALLTAGTMTGRKSAGLRKIVCLDGRKFGLYSAVAGIGPELIAIVAKPLIGALAAIGAGVIFRAKVAIIARPWGDTFVALGACEMAQTDAGTVGTPVNHSRAFVLAVANRVIIKIRLA